MESTRFDNLGGARKQRRKVALPCRKSDLGNRLPLTPNPYRCTPHTVLLRYSDGLTPEKPLQSKKLIFLARGTPFMRIEQLRVVIWLLLASSLPARAQTRAEIDALKAQFATQESEITNQEKEIQRLRATLEAQKRLLDQLVPATPSEPQKTELVPQPPTAAAVQRALPGAQVANTSTVSPWTFHLGNFALTPGGFLDLTTLFRTTVVGSGIATNFNNIPFSNTPAGRLTETRPSAQNSRVSFRVKTCVGKNPADQRCKDGTAVTGYLEADFLGFQPVNGVVTSNSNRPRLRLFWVNLKRGPWEILAGQSDSFLTPNRVGVSAESFRQPCNVEE